MDRRTCLGLLAAGTAAGAHLVWGKETGPATSPVSGQKLEFKTISLPQPDTASGRPLMQVLRERRSSRDFSPARLPLQTLSNLLWAAFGINREDGGRTAPSGHNWQEVEIYLATADGLFRYEATKHELKPVIPEDIRAATGVQAFTTVAPLNLVYVADTTKTGTDATEQELFPPVDVGFIGQNVYLFCASSGLASVFRGTVKRAELAKAMQLRPGQKVLFCQTVGYPKP